ncbi:MAG: hypothetical protein ABSA66_00875 [Roseiarcus sp.]
MRLAIQIEYAKRRIDGGQVTLAASRIAASAPSHVFARLFALDAAAPRD